MSTVNVNLSTPTIYKRHADSGLINTYNCSNNIIAGKTMYISIRMSNLYEKVVVAKYQEFASCKRK